MNIEEVNRILVFDILGKMGHFKRMDTNVSSLSYSFPPRTVLTGTISAITGEDRDSYYGLFDPDNCRLALQIKTKLRKTVFTVNYRYGSRKDPPATGPKGGATQIPIEVILAESTNGQDNMPSLCYRVYFASKEESYFDKLAKSIAEGSSVLPLYFGSCGFPAWFEFVDIIEGDDLQLRSPKETSFVSIINTKKIKSLKMQTGNFIKEHTPLFFNKKRELQETADFIYEKNLDPLECVPTEKYFRVALPDGQKENILFME